MAIDATGFRRSAATEQPPYGLRAWDEALWSAALSAQGTCSIHSAVHCLQERCAGAAGGTESRLGRDFIVSAKDIIKCL